MRTMADFQAIRWDEARSIQVTLEKQKCCSELGQASRFCHDQNAHVQKYLEEKNENDQML